MRFMSLVKSTEDIGEPPAEFWEQMGKLEQSGVPAGSMIDSGGLAPSVTGATLRLTAGETTVTDGPFTEVKEVIGGYAIFELRSQEEAVEVGKAFLEIHRRYWPGWEGELEIRRLLEADEIACPVGQ